MAGNLGSLVVSLGLDGAQFFAGLTKSEYEARKSMRAIQASVEEVRSTITKFVNALATISGGALTFAGLIAAFEAVKHATIESEQSLFQLNAALKATGGAAGLTAGDLEALAREIRGSTTFSTEDIRKAETALLRFRDIRREVFDEAMRQVPNLAVALGIALPEAAQKLGRALEDPAKGLRGLREAGVFLSETQIILAKRFQELGDQAAAQKIVMDAVALSTGGAAKAAMEGLFGVTERLARSFKDLQTAAGKKLFGDNHAEVEGFIGLLERLIARVEKTNLNLADLFTKPGLLAKTAFEEAQALFSGYHEPEPSPRSAKGKIGGLAPPGFDLTPEQDAARQAALDAKIKAVIEARTIAQLNTLKSFAEKSAQFYASETAVQKYNLNTQTANLEFAYSQGKTATAEYYGSLEAIARQSFTEQDKIFSRRVQAEEAIIKNGLALQADRDAARARLVGIVAQADTARLAMHERLNLLAQQEIVAIQKLKDEYVELGASAAEAAGDLAGAAAARFDVANRERRRKLEAEASSLDPTTASLGQFGLNVLDAQRQRIVVQNELTAATQRYSLVVGAVGIEQARIDLLLQTGAITEIDSLNKRAEVAQKYVVIQTKLADEQERTARLLGAGPERDAALLEVQKLRLGIDQLAASSDVLAKKFSDIFSSGFSTFLTDLIDHTKSVKQAFTDMAKSIEQQISKIAAQNISEKLFGKEGPLGGLGAGFASLFGGKTAGAGADASVAALGASAVTADAGVAALGTAAATTAGLFTAIDLPATTFTASLAAAALAADAFALSASAAAGASASSSAGNYASAIAAAVASGGSFAGGGSPPVGRWSVVGENGPELFMPKTSGTVIPMDEYRNKRSGNVSVTNIINVPEGTSRASADQIGLAAGRFTQRSIGKLG